MKFFPFKTLMILSCCIAFAANIYAQANLSIQGVVKNSDGTAVANGTYPITFKLYTAESGGTAVWTEEQTNIKITGGIYAAILGSVTPLTAAFNVPYYLGVSVDGSAELQPRTRLTSAPYSLSLIGQDNIFPSTGAVGAGTTAPANGYQLHVKNPSGEGKLLIDGSTASRIVLQKGSSAAYMGWDPSDNIFRLDPGANNTSVLYNGAEKLRIDNGGIFVSGAVTATNGFIGNLSGNATGLNGTVSLSGSTFNSSSHTYFQHAGSSKMRVDDDGIDVYGLIVAEGNIYFSGSYGWLNSTGNTGTNANGYYSVSATNRIRASEFNAYSDRRIKKDFRLADNSSDLDILKKLRVTDYRHIDEIKNGSAYKKGFIAQEVEAVFPEAVTKSSDFLPDVYEKSTTFSVSEGQITITLSKQHGVKVGDQVRLILSDGKKELSVAAVNNEYTFVLKGWEAAQPEWVFVYGKKVDDFLQVDYDRIHTLSVSATQELARRLEALEKENANLRSQNNTLRSDVGAVNGRLQILENLILGTKNTVEKGK